jgi:hypothetical protein
MANVEGTRRMIQAGRTLVWIGLGSLFLWLVMTLTGVWIPLNSNMPWHVISVVHDLFAVIAQPALKIGAALWLGGWVIAGFLE